MEMFLDKREKRNNGYSKKSKQYQLVSTALAARDGVNAMDSWREPEEAAEI